MQDIRMFRYFLVLYILYFLISVFKGNTTNQLDGQSNIPCNCQEHIPNNTTDQCALQQDNTNNQTSTSDVDFFDSSFTFSNESIEVSCCTRDASLTSVTCGRGSSCTGQCSAIEASLCPSGNCTGNFEDCSPSLGLDEGENHGKGRSAATRPSWEFRWCVPACQVRYHSACCYHPTCRAQRGQLCSWINYLTGGFLD